MKHFRLTQDALGQQIGVTKGYLSVIMNDKEPITKKVLEGLMKSFTRLNIHWLLTGEGEMFLKEQEPGGDSVVMEPAAPVYEKGRGEGRLEYLERKVEELLRRVGDLEEEVRGCKK